MEKDIGDKWFYFPVVSMVIYFLYRFLDFSKLASVFPMEKTNDISSYIAQLYFLVNYGFHEMVPHWGDGFVLFQAYPPGWFYFALPLYHLFNDYLVATFVSIVLMLVIIFLTINYFGKLNKLSFIKRVGFFIFLFGNPIAIGNFIRLGRVTELFGWMTFVILALLFLYYINREFDWKFYVTFIIFYSVLMLSHPVIITVFPILLVSLFLSKKLWKDKIGLFVASLFVYLVTSFWWRGFITNLDQVDADIITQGLLTFNVAWFWTSIGVLTITIILWISFYFYWKNYRNERDLYFFIPIFIISLLVFFKLIFFVPFLNRVYPDIYILMFLLFSLYYFFKTDYFFKFGSVIKLGLVALAVVSILISVNHTPMVRDYSIYEIESTELMSQIEGRYFVFGIPGSKFLEAEGEEWDGGYVAAPSSNMYNYYSYGPVYYDLIGVNPVIFAGSDAERRKLLWDTMWDGRRGRCNDFKDGLDLLEAEEILTFTESCEFMESCGFEFKARNGNACLYFNTFK